MFRCPLPGVTTGYHPRREGPVRGGQLRLLPGLRRRRAPHLPCGRAPLQRPSRARAFPLNRPRTEFHVPLGAEAADTGPLTARCRPVPPGRAAGPLPGQVPRRARDRHHLGHA
jgi:hypothetical protein